jgi:hypothetical protein
LVSDIKEELRFENRVLRRIFGPKRDEVTGDWREKCLMRSFITYTLRQTE